ncbi:hypothetical protein GCM10011316_17350 [Roseibium aquae]|uniref:Uncharacterized protein n=1 Tax=Roseibium aquae TaxID=1323746 RepID=A0A916TJ27_9HYPH|nr:hypothetical protein [Roseibium aquae]GGB45793.1 hypothetical protein GCM10011316_17350 [Roseibium aquae]
MTMEAALASLAKTCEAIANGRFDDIDDLYEVITNEAVPGEIRALAESFAGMVVQVEAREFHSSQLISDLSETKRQLEIAEAKLRKENAELKTRLDKFEVAYDETEAQMEVQKVAESDYFKSLQSRAKQLRSRFKSS